VAEDLWEREHNMKFNANHYFRAATERMKQARILYGQNDHDCYAIAMYTAGVAVECLLRAFKATRTDEFDERHDLRQLFSHSHILQLNESLAANRRSPEQALESAQSMRACIAEIYNLWANDYRYASEDRLKSQLRSMGKIHGVKGDVLKASAKQLLNAAEKLIENGAVIWKNLQLR